MSDKNNSRRFFLKFGAVSGSALLLNACGGTGQSPAANQQKKETDDKKTETEIEVTAAEDLMREHGIIRRALLVYAESAVRLRRGSKDFSPEALQNTAKLFRSFGEDYHEKKLEEAYI
jgi:hypothetical protein